ncbi:hypothetical protein [Rathayibacter toxicus]|uniref:hypothetical protein n=1 Tax=Rathayibacter toxicus TaxID=145458 RepID=UPI0011B09B4E|nr:hypothetical protein [Rathayibacter toxicus]QWL50414.1 hypothetical protein E2R44_01060 [Rathayibacter toxicus]
MSDSPWLPPHASNNPPQVATTWPPQQQERQNALRSLDITATIFLTIVSLIITAPITVGINENTKNSYDISMYFLLKSTLIAIWSAWGGAVAYTIVRLLRNKKAWWVPLAGLGVSIICLYLTLMIITGFQSF